MARYLVTGGAGFIGSHLVASLVGDGHVVRVLDDLSSGKAENLPRGVELIASDVTEPASVGRALDDVDGCFHLAAIASVERSRREWLHSHTVNLTGTITVFDEVRRAQSDRGCSLPVVYASSAAVYGNAGDVPISEKGITRPVNAYGADKLGCELHAAVAGSIHNVKTVGLRFFNVYGPRQDPESPYSGVISIFCQKILKGDTLHIYGDGKQMRDFIHVDDAVGALRSAMASAAADPQIFNVCTGIGTTISQLGTIIAKIYGVPFSPHYAPSRMGDLRVSMGDPRMAREKLGFEASILLRDGLARTLETMAAGQTDASPRRHAKVRPTKGGSPDIPEEPCPSRRIPVASVGG